MNEPVAYINVEERKLEWAHPIKWETPTVAVMDKVPLYTAPPKREWQGLTDVAMVWDKGYRQGIEDERTSKANIGIAGFGAKVEPARQNPYKTVPPQREWVGLTDDEINAAWGNNLSFARAIEAKLKEKNCG